MLKVDRKFINEINDSIDVLISRDATAATDALNAADATAATKAGVAQLKESLHQAMRLEASTVPPYLVAAWSIKESPGYQNKEIRELILGIAKEEMLHMMGVANILAALGEAPKIANKEIVLDWGVDKLPIGGDLVPQLAPFSMKLLTDLFMEIEEPKNPVHYVVLKKKKFALEGLQYGTIGEFYEAIISLINSLPEDPFKNGAAYPQIALRYDVRIGQIGHSPITDFVVTNKTEAINLLNWIVDQGEGSSEDPLDGDGDPAHYYRFAGIYKGGKLIPDITQELGYAYDRAGHPINCDFTAIHQFTPNPKMKDFAPDSEHFKVLKKCNDRYFKMFRDLQDFYEGNNPQEIRNSIRSMNNMVGDADDLFRLTPSICPSFEWIEPVPIIT